jgi:uncharacterized membrane protein YheB (UPF0754 family)
MIWLLPLIGALIGWFTNSIAVKMLFHPHREISVFGLKLQGVLPKRQKQLAREIGQLVSSELLSADEITEMLCQKARSRRTVDMIAHRIESLLSSKLPETIPSIAMVLHPKLVRKIREMFLKDLQVMIEEFVKVFSADLDREIDIPKIVEEKISSYSTTRLEELAMSVMRQEFRFIEWIGAILGFLIGLIQVTLLSYEADLYRIWQLLF